MAIRPRNAATVVASASQVARWMSDSIGDPGEIARAILYIVQTPPELNIEELVIRPAKALPL